MTDDRTLERAARSWIEEGTTRAPDRPVIAALRAIESTPQERDLRIPWRLPIMNSRLRLAAAAVVGVLAVGLIYLNLPGRGEVGAPTASPSPSATTPTGDIPLVPPSPLPDPPGDALAGDLVGRTYGVNPPETNGDQQLILTLRGADDPHCTAMYGGRSTCFTVLWGPTVKANDPGARGPARMVDGNLVLGLALVPFDEPCVGSSATYAIEDAGQTLRGIDPPACTFPGFRELRATSASSMPWVFDTQGIEGDFALGMKLTLPSGWKPLHGIVGNLAIVHTGYPEGPDSTWWGPDLLLVEDATIHDPSTVVSSESEAADRSHYVAWPSDVFAYFTALPGVTVVSGPEPIIIDGVTGTQMVVMTPPLRPLVWLQGDFAPLGGGEPAIERRLIVVETGGHNLFIDFIEDPETFDARYTEFQTILDSISFE